MDHLLIYKYLSNNASEEEIGMLFQWIDDNQDNKTLFIQYKKIWAMTATNGSHDDWKKVQNIINRKKNRYPFSKVLRYAAIFIGVIGLSFVLNRTLNTTEKLIIVDKDVLLKLDNGNSEVLLSKENSNMIDDVIYTLDSEIGILRYDEKGNLDQPINSGGINSIPQAELVYHELLVPHGKRFQIILSDGTIAHLNAGTSLKYPIDFLKGKNRTVFLDGEAYFDVAKDSKHPFIVNVNNLNVRALGTQFNISSYSDNNLVSTVLTEGAVAIYQEDEVFDLKKATLLQPNYRATWNKNKKEMGVNMVDPSIHTAWMEGKIIFKNTSFYNIRKALERIYNVTIINNNQVLDKNTYNVFFDGESIEQILETLNINFSIEYTIQNNQVIIN